jgi:hypothetical protein
MRPPGVDRWQGLLDPLSCAFWALDRRGHVRAGAAGVAGLVAKSGIQCGGTGGAENHGYVYGSGALDDEYDNKAPEVSSRCYVR